MSSIRMLSYAAAIALMAGSSVSALAQPQPKPADVDVVTIAGVGTVTVLTYKVQFVSADPATRRVVLQMPNGNRWAVIAPPLVGDLSYFQVGQRLTIRVAPGVVSSLGKAKQGTPGEVIKEAALEAGLPGWPEDFGIREIIMTATLVGVDKAGGTITFEGPGGNVRTVRAANAKVLQDLQKVEPGDLARITFLEALSVDATGW